MDKTESANKDLYRDKPECRNDPGLGGNDTVSSLVIHQISDPISIIIIGFIEDRKGNYPGKEKLDRIFEVELGKFL